jgi:hypothetical protein
MKPRETCVGYLLDLVNEELSSAGGRAFSLLEMQRARYLIFLIRQSAVAVTVK